MENNGISRRNLLKTGAVAAGVFCVGGAAGFADARTVAMGEVKKWDFTTDIIVIGYGAAGANAALAGGASGKNVILLEKAPSQGGNSGVNLGGIILPKTYEDAVKLYTAYSFDVCSKEEIEGFARQMIQVPEYLKSLGFELRYADRKPSFPNMVPDMFLTGTVLNPTGVAALQAFREMIDKDKKITTMFNTPAKALVQTDKGEIIGVKAVKDGKEIFIKARNGVILSCGGYENNKKMIANYNYPGLGEYIFPCGTPYNTGDGISMGIAAGAQLWHFPSLEWASFCCLDASKKFGVAVPTPFFGLYGKNYIYVNKFGKRFMKDNQWLMHTKEPINALNFSNGGADMGSAGGASEFINMPPWLVFDEATRKRGPICANKKDTKDTRGGHYYYSVVHDMYDWSEDNMAEVEKGWVLKADSISELAKKMNVDATTLEETVKKYNGYCEAGVDPEFGRAKKDMKPIAEGPFYAMKCGIAMINTQGGPKRNAANQVLDTEDNPIPRLYSAGELGSFFGFLYQGANNFAEAIITGKNAAEALAASKPHKY